MIQTVLQAPVCFLRQGIKWAEAGAISPGLCCFWGRDRAHDLSARKSAGRSGHSAFRRPAASSLAGGLKATRYSTSAVPPFARTNPRLSVTTPLNEATARAGRDHHRRADESLAGHQYSPGDRTNRRSARGPRRSPARTNPRRRPCLPNHSGERRKARSKRALPVSDFVAGPAQQLEIRDRALDRGDRG